MTQATEFPRWSISSCCFHINAVLTGTAIAWTSPRFIVQERVNLMLRWHIFLPFPSLLLKIITWILQLLFELQQHLESSAKIAAPSQKALTSKMARWFPSELPPPEGKAGGEGESWGWRVKARGHHQDRATGSKGYVLLLAQTYLRPRWRRLAGRDFMVKANVYCVSVRGRMNQLNTLEAIFCLHSWLVTWDLIQTPFDISLLQEILLFSLYIFFPLDLILLAITAVIGSYLWLL